MVRKGGFGTEKTGIGKGNVFSIFEFREQKSEVGRDELSYFLFLTFLILVNIKYLQNIFCVYFQNTLQIHNTFCLITIQKVKMQEMKMRLPNSP